MWIEEKVGWINADASNSNKDFYFKTSHLTQQKSNLKLSEHTAIIRRMSGILIETGFEASTGTLNEYLELAFNYYNQFGEIFFPPGVFVRTCTYFRSKEGSLNLTYVVIGQDKEVPGFLSLKPILKSTQSPDLFVLPLVKSRKNRGVALELTEA